MKGLRPLQWFGKLIGGALGRVALTGLIVGAFIIIAGVTPGEWAVQFWEHPPNWVTHWGTTYGLLIVGLGVMFFALTYNRWDQRRRALDALAELQSDAIHKIWNGPVRSDAELDELEAYDREWQANVTSILERTFSRAEVTYFARLGVIPIVERDATFNPKHAKLLREYAVRESRLRNIVFKYSK